MCVLIEILCIALGAMSLPLAYWIQYVESGGCCVCEQKKSCVAYKKIFSDKSNLVSEFMLVAFILVNRQKKCEKMKKINLMTYIFYVVVVGILILFLFWSERNNIRRLLYILTTIFLLALSIVDWNTQYIPVEYTCVIFLCGLIHLFADNTNWLQYLIGLIAVSGFLYIVNRVATPILKKRYGDDEIDSVIGDGDIKLMAATGLLLGWKLNFIALGIGCIAGSVIHLILMKVKGSGRQFAFGPYLSLGVYITMICGEQLVSWYLNMLGVNTLL